MREFCYWLVNWLLFFLSVGQEPPKGDEHEQVYDYDQVFHPFGQGIEFMQYVRHRRPLSD
jgi:hypothetical protein